MNVPTEKKCPHCGVRFAWNGSAWMIVDAHGRMSLSSSTFGKPEPEPELRKCLQCRRPLELGATRVEEVEE
jgi:uncharacterized protein with PIN domain